MLFSVIQEKTDHQNAPILNKFQLEIRNNFGIFGEYSVQEMIQRCQPLDTKNQTDNPKKSDFPHKNRIFTKSSETITKYHNFFHLRMLAQRHDSNSYS